MCLGSRGGTDCSVWAEAQCQSPARTSAHGCIRPVRMLYYDTLASCQSVHELVLVVRVALHAFARPFATTAEFVSGSVDTKYLAALPPLCARTVATRAGTNGCATNGTNSSTPGTDCTRPKWVATARVVVAMGV